MDVYQQTYENYLMGYLKDMGLFLTIFSIFYTILLIIVIVFLFAKNTMLESNRILSKIAFWVSCICCGLCIIPAIFLLVLGGVWKWFFFPFLVSLFAIVFYSYRIYRFYDELRDMQKFIDEFNATTSLHARQTKQILSDIEKIKILADELEKKRQEEIERKLKESKSWSLSEDGSVPKEFQSRL